MGTILYKSIEEVCRDALTFRKIVIDDDVNIVGTYDELRPILNWLVKNSDYEIHNVEFSNEQNDEYLLTLDDEDNIWVEPAWRRSENSYVPVRLDGFILAYKDINEEIIKNTYEYAKVFLFDIDDGDDVADEFKIDLKFNTKDVSISDALFDFLFR